MNSWQDYQVAEPILREAELTYAQFERFQQTYPSNKVHEHGIDARRMQKVRQSVLSNIAAEVNRLPGKVYYWLCPFYPGDFALLTRALIEVGHVEVRRSHPSARRAFYQFFRSLPPGAKDRLGREINDPELLQRSQAIQTQINSLKSSLKQRLDRDAAN